jgi:flavin-dependent dehydrogenase
MIAIPAVQHARGLPTHVDVLVVGGGPAGAMAAIRSARAGLATLLVDRAAHPREKVCGCCLAPMGQQVLRQAGLEHVLDRARRVQRVLLSWGGRAVQVRRGGTAVVSRGELDSALLRAAADAGATLAWPFVGMIEAGGTVRLRGPGGERCVHARIRIAADGLQGVSLRDNPRFAWRVRGTSRMGLGAILPAQAIRLDDDEIRMQVHRDGYVGLVRLPDGRVDAAAAVRADAIRASGGVAGCMERLLGASMLDRGAVQRAPWQGTPQLWRMRRHVHDHDTLVAGDAAGYVEPFTGEGMGWAMATGEAAGHHAAAVLAGETTMKAWPARARPLTRMSGVRCGMVARILRHPALVRAGLQAAERWPSVASRIAESLGAVDPLGGRACRA